VIEIVSPAVAAMGISHVRPGRDPAIARQFDPRLRYRADHAAMRDNGAALDGRAVPSSHAFWETDTTDTTDSSTPSEGEEVTASTSADDPRVARERTELEKQTLALSSSKQKRLRSDPSYPLNPPYPSLNP
jgi:hypothetical protein